MTNSALVTAARKRQARSCTHFYGQPVKGMRCRDCVIEEAEAQIEALRELIKSMGTGYGDAMIDAALAAAKRP